MTQKQKRGTAEPRSAQREDKQPLTIKEMQQNHPLYFFGPIRGCGSSTKWYAEHAGKQVSPKFDTLNDLLRDYTFVAPTPKQYDSFRIVTPTGMKLNILAVMNLLQNKQ